MKYRIPDGTKDFFTIWAAVLLFIACIAAFLGLIWGDIILIGWVVETKKLVHLWWIVPLNVLGITGAIAALIYSQE